MNLDEYKEKKMKDPEFARAYKESQLEMSVIQNHIDDRSSQTDTVQNAPGNKK